ncbi:alpha/beta fold hydrolase [Nonomuraea rhodomycinica]|uniref:Alpha/beta hydrolase n=1 Tax=Nonomuraea rhodomycinica TaxID=1712872 RepID=A0A7Y6IYI2_9ACTN|nr:alpha/beta hydrolase [Nonomuraea rhodomycinica]NUW46193.1 alpha/beta hydrolase [Nonomuraea rhodomycinica]
MFVEVPGGRLAYDSAGEGPLVVCVPGLGDTRDAYRFLRPPLVEAGYRVVTADLRGHGESSAGWDDYSQAAVGGDIVALLEELDAPGAVLLGNSYAGGGIVHAAAQAPERVAGIVPIDGFIRALPLNVALRVLLRLIASSPRLWSLYYAMAHRTAKPADLAEHRVKLVAMLGDPVRREAMSAMLLNRDLDAERVVAQVHCPALVLMGAKDPDFPDPAAEARAQASLLRGQAVVIDDAGHYPMSEFPGRTAEALLPFLKNAF